MKKIKMPSGIKVEEKKKSGRKILKRREGSSKGKKRRGCGNGNGFRDSTKGNEDIYKQTGTLF